MDLNGFFAVGIVGSINHILREAIPVHIEGQKRLEKAEKVLIFGISALVDPEGTQRLLKKTIGMLGVTASREIEN